MHLACRLRQRAVDPDSSSCPGIDPTFPPEEAADIRQHLEDGGGALCLLKTKP